MPAQPFLPPSTILYNALNLLPPSTFLTLALLITPFPGWPIFLFLSPIFIYLAVQNVLITWPELLWDNVHKTPIPFQSTSEIKYGFPPIIAHKLGSGEFPEHTLPALRSVLSMDGDANVHITLTLLPINDMILQSNGDADDVDNKYGKTTSNQKVHNHELTLLSDPPPFTRQILKLTGLDINVKTITYNRLMDLKYLTMIPVSPQCDVGGYVDTRLFDGVGFIGFREFLEAWDGGVLMIEVVDDNPVVLKVLEQCLREFNINKRKKMKTRGNGRAKSIKDTPTSTSTSTLPKSHNMQNFVNLTSGSKVILGARYSPHITSSLSSSTPSNISVYSSPHTIYFLLLLYYLTLLPFLPIHDYEWVSKALVQKTLILPHVDVKRMCSDIMLLYPKGKSNTYFYRALNISVFYTLLFYSTLVSNKRFTKHMIARGFCVLVWEVNSEEGLRYARENDLGIITDYPERAKRVFEAY